MKSALSVPEMDDLIEDSEGAAPASEFVASVREWFEEHGFITERQEEALRRAIEGVSNGW